LRDNNFKVLTMANLAYDDSNNYIRISGGNDGTYEPVPNNQNEFGARITDPEEETDSLSTAEEEEEDLINEVTEVEEIVSKENPPAIKGNDYDTISDEASSRSVEGNGESQIPSEILRSILEP
jgi:hypothetical protein